jgi:hypothetical protein
VVVVDTSPRGAAGYWNFARLAARRGDGAGLRSSMREKSVERARESARTGSEDVSHP